MAPNFVPFTGFSYRDGLASLGQGLNRLSDSFERAQDRRLFEEWGKDPSLANAARTGNPALIGLSIKDQQTRRTEALQAQATREGLSILDRLGGGGGLGGAPASQGAPSTTSAATAPTGARIGDITPDEDLAIRTVIGEAAGEKPEGWKWVAGVIANRAKGGNMSLRDAVLAPNQFEPWSSRRKELEGYDPNSPRYKFTAAAILPILRGQEPDPTGGATHFYAPKAQAGLGRRPPSWDDGTGVDVGNHRFFRLGYNGTGRHGIPQGGTDQPFSVASAAPMAPGGVPQQQPAGGLPLTPQEFAAAKADGTLPPDADPSFIAEQYRTEPVYRQRIDEWKARRGGAPAPQQVAGAGRFPTPAEYDAAADAIRVGREGGPRLVLSPSSPLTQGGNRPAISAQRIAGSGTGAPAPYVPPGTVINVPSGAGEDDITQAEIDSGMRTPEGGFLPAGSLTSSDAPSGPGMPLPYGQPAQPGPGAPQATPAPAQAPARSPNAPNWQTVDQVPQQAQEAVMRKRDITELSRMVANPHTPDGLRKVAEMRLAALLNENDKLTEPVKTYLWAKAHNQHGGLGFIEFTDRNKKDEAGAKLKAETAAREAEAVRLGLDPLSPEGQRYILTGQIPTAERADRKAIGEADAAIASAEETIGALRTAKSLSSKAYDGILAGARGGIAANFGSAAGTATMELDNVLQTTVLAGLRSIFGSNPTEGERKIALEIAGSSNQPRQVRESIIDRAIQAAERRLGMARSKAEELRGGSYYKPGGGPAREPRSAGPQASAASSGIPAGAVEMLRSDPSLAAQFDAKYGAGASRRVLGQ